MSTPDYIPIHHVMHIEYGNKALLLLLYSLYYGCDYYVIVIILFWNIFAWIPLAYILWTY